MEKGAKVEVLRYPVKRGLIAKVVPNEDDDKVVEAFDIDYDDGKKEKGVPKRLVRRFRPPPSKTEYGLAAAGSGSTEVGSDDTWPRKFTSSTNFS